MVAFADGEILATGSGHPVPLKDHLALGRDQVLPAGNAFSDGTRDVIALTEGRGGNPTTSAGISVVNLQAGTSTLLGTGSFAAGDPQQPGAFVTVASSSSASVGGENTANPDSELELLDANHSPVVLASAAALASDLGWTPSTPVSLLPVPSPMGALVAVEVQNLLEAPGADAGLVVLDRSGTVVAVQKSGRGPTSDSLAVWSPNATALAYASEGRTGNALVVWTVGKGDVTAPLPAGVGAGQCLWSPTGGAVLCDSAHSSRGRVQQTWSLITPEGGRAASLAGPGFALAWFGGST